jgi:hypothetical protein
MPRASKKEKRELEERLRALQREQKRLAKEISALSVQNSGSRSAPSKTRSASAAPSRRRSAGVGAPTEMKAYFSSGSFRGGGKLRHERAVQRNKAIFMLVVAVVAIYIFFAWVY